RGWDLSRIDLLGELEGCVYVAEGPQSRGAADGDEVRGSALPRSLGVKTACLQERRNGGATVVNSGARGEKPGEAATAVTRYRLIIQNQIDVEAQTLSVNCRRQSVVRAAPTEGDQWPPARELRLS